MMAASCAIRAITVVDDGIPDAGHWVRTEVDQLLDEMPDTPVLKLAAELDAKAAVFDAGPQMAQEIASELRRRAEAGVRFWPRPTLVRDQT